MTKQTAVEWLAEQYALTNMVTRKLQIVNNDLIRYLFPKEKV